MEEGELVLRYGLPPAPEDLPEIRAQLEALTLLESQRQGAGDTLSMKELCVLLFSVGDVQDWFRIWCAKQASFDAACSIDVQLLCGAGFERTLAHLATLDSNEARAAIAYLRKCEAADDFEGRDEAGGRLATVLDDYRRYYGITG